MVYTESKRGMRGILALAALVASPSIGVHVYQILFC